MGTARRVAPKMTSAPIIPFWWYCRVVEAPPVETPPLSIGSARLIFTGPYLDTGILDGHTYDVSHDGQRFLVIQVSEEERAPRRFHLVQNWFEELKAKVPTTR